MQYDKKKRHKRRTTNKFISTTSSTTILYHSVIRGTTAAVYMLNSAGRVASSLLEGGAITSGSGTFTCVGAYDQDFTSLDASCQ